MKAVIYSLQDYEQPFFDKFNQHFKHELTYLHAHLNQHSVKLAEGFKTVCCFVNDNLSAPILDSLAASGVQLIVLRSAGFNHIDLPHAKQLGLAVARVPRYSPYAVAEHAVALILTLNRKTHRAFNRVRESNFALHGLMGFDLHDKTVGVIGTGKIGQIFASIMRGFGCHVVAYDKLPNENCIKAGVRYIPLTELIEQADIISLHCPLTPETQHLINAQTIACMKPQVMLINTSRGGLVDTKAVIDGLKSHQIGYLGLDVYEEEADLFFEDLSEQVLQDDVFARLLTFPNVLITSHQAFFTQEALNNIVQTTLQNILDFEQGTKTDNFL
ncbi:MAG: 2-hydroxyacid dehydrogenase [Gammaproteobacteria bacterium]